MRTATTTTKKKWELTNNEEFDRIGIGEYFSLVAASNVSHSPPLPPTSVGGGHTTVRAGVVRGGGGGDTFDAATTNSNDALAKMTAGLVALQAASSSLLLLLLLLPLRIIVQQQLKSITNFSYYSRHHGIPLSCIVLMLPYGVHR